MSNLNSTISIKTIDERRVAMGQISDLAAQIQTLAQENQVTVILSATGIVRDDEGDVTRHCLELHHLDSSSAPKMAELEAVRGMDTDELDNLKTFQSEAVRRGALMSEAMDMFNNHRIPSSLLRFILLDEFKAANKALVTGEATWLLANDQTEEFSKICVRRPEVAKNVEKIKEQGGGELYRTLRSVSLEDHVAMGFIATSEKMAEQIHRSAMIALERIHSQR